MSRIAGIFACVTAVVTVGVQAAGQDIRLQHEMRPFPVEWRLAGDFSFWERFKIAFDQQADELFADQFHPFTLMRRSIESAEGKPYDLYDRSTSVARNTLSKSLVSSLRKATVDLPILSWLGEHQGFLADFLEDSVDSVEEEAVAPLDPSYGARERSWWKQLSENRETHYGIRPLRTDPYAFLSMPIEYADTLFLLAHVRYYYHDFADHRFDFALSVPLSPGFSIDVSTSYQFGQHAEEKKLVFKLFKQLTGGGFLHVGLEAQVHPALLAGITLPW